MDPFLHHSCIVSRKASVSSDQPAATRAGIDILKKGGNAADAAVATMAAVSVLQPVTCGIGGDCQCLFFSNKDKSVQSINGSGRTGEKATLEVVTAAGITDPMAADCVNHGLWVSVPGTIAGMVAVVKNFGSGKLTLREVLAPAISLAEEGVSMPYKIAALWKQTHQKFMPSRNAKDLLIGGEPPSPGKILYAPKLAKCFKEIAEHGAEAFYCKEIAQNIVKAVQQSGGVLTLADMKNHLAQPTTSAPSDAISVDFRGFRIWEMKPNTTGIVALVVLNILEPYDLKALGHNSAEYVHLVSEAIKFAFLECWDYLCDPKCCSKRLKGLLSEDTAQRIRNGIDMEKTCNTNLHIPGGNTSYVAAVDADGNGCSFICSVSSYFGSGIIPDDCGFVLHDRAKSMSLDQKSTQVHGPNKRPVSTIIPALVTDVESGDLLAVMGVIGRWMQPQGHVQVLLNMIVFGMDPQVSLCQPRFCVGNPTTYAEYITSFNLLCLEVGIDDSIIPYLEKKGYNCKGLSGSGRDTFGRGHVIARTKLFGGSSWPQNSDTWCSGADPRSDGCAMGL